MTRGTSRRSFLQDAGAFLTAAQCLSLSAAVAEPGQGGVRRCEVLVIGAGAAGLAAARELVGQGRQVIVVEARDRTGGRVWTSKSWDSLPIDLGASWIHGHRGNPLVDLAKQFGVRTTVTNYDSVAPYNDAGKVLPLKEAIRAMNTLDQMESGLKSLEATFDAQQAPISLEAALRRWQDANNVSEPERRFQRLIARNEIEVEYAADLDELAFPQLDDSEEFTGEQRTFPGGYGGIIDGLAADLDIRLGTLVKEIDHSRSPVVVETSSGRFEAERVVVTVPLGVLKRGTIRFTPELPEDKRSAIDRLGMGLLNKVALRFDRAFWPKLHILAFLTDRADQWSDLFNLEPTCGYPVLIAFKTGRAALADERQSDGELVETLMRQVRSAFGSKTLEPREWQVTRWASDPLSGGSYSFFKVGAKPADYDALAAPIGDRLFFAGEATNRLHPATVHGAYLSGLREAGRIAKL